MKRFIPILTFLIGAISGIIGTIIWSNIPRHYDPSDDWGIYFKTRFAYDDALEKKKSEEYKSELMEQNHAAFNRLVAHQDLVPVYYDSKNPDSYKKFYKSLADLAIQTYRGGWSMDGGQFAVGIEFVSRFDYQRVPELYRK